VVREVHISVKPMAGTISPGMSKAVSKHPNLHLHPEVTTIIHWFIRQEFVIRLFA
jgi:hypothetical protein